MHPRLRSATDVGNRCSVGHTLDVQTRSCHHHRRTLVPRSICALAALLLPISHASASILYSTGFESPEFVPGQLAGQAGWQTTASDFSRPATQIINTNARTGTQCLKIDALTISGTEWSFVPINFTADASASIVRIGVDMLVETGPDKSQGYGIDAYDRAGVRIGQFSLATSNLLTINNTTTTLAAGIGARDVWISYLFTLDFGARTISLSVNGQAPLAALPFGPGAGNDLGDADIRIVGAAVDAAYFDNYSVVSLPAPATGSLTLIGLAMRTRRRRTR